MSNHYALSLLWKESLSLLAFLHTPPAPVHYWQGATHRQWGSLHDPQHSGLLSRLRSCAERFPSLVDRMFRQIHRVLGWAALPDDMTIAKWASLLGRNALLLWLLTLQDGQIAVVANDKFCNAIFQNVLLHNRIQCRVNCLRCFPVPDEKTAFSSQISPSF